MFYTTAHLVVAYCACIIILCIFVVLLFFRNKRRCGAGGAGGAGYGQTEPIDIRVITLPSEKYRKRRRKVTQSFNKQKIKFKFFKAVDGHKLDSDVVDGVHQVWPAMKGEIGCYMSHCKLWDTEKIRLILEDDVNIPENFMEKLRQYMKELPEDWDILFLGARFNDTSLNTQHSTHLQLTKSSFKGTHAYIINSKFKQKVQKHCQIGNINKPIDDKMSEFLLQLKAYNVSPEFVEAYSHTSFDDGTSTFRQAILSDHQKLPVPSQKLSRYKEILEETLRLWHHFAEDNNIIYCLIAGSLIGYYRTGSSIPWDDDHDLVVRQKDIAKVHEAWKKGKNKQSSGDAKFEMKDIVVDGKNVQLLRNSEESGDNAWYKFRLPSQPVYEDIGGVDIWYAKEEKDGKLYESITNGMEVPAPHNYDTERECPTGRYGNINARAVKKSRGKPYLDKKYGPKWTINEHPSKK